MGAGIVGAGSSPRGRGKRPPRIAWGSQTRLIPAWAGKTATGVSSPSLPWAHPRVGGENEPHACHCRAWRGSSPRGRGKPAHVTRFTRCRGLIPAWAGKTCRWGQSWLIIAAHPRVGGENPVTVGDNAKQFGSSPRGRGKPPVQTSLVPTAWAHPRVGGENRRCRRMTWACSGSSPRGRGKHADLRSADQPPRLIPAWAGKTGLAGTENSHVRAHPRVGGENTLRSTVSRPASGSSPRGRGKRNDDGRHAPRRGLIPAWAGKTERCCGRSHRVAAHPRVGGENPQRPNPR